MVSPKVIDPHRPRPVRLLVIAGLAAFVYVVLVGGTTLGELSPWLWMLNAVIVGVLFTRYVLHASDAADRIDRRLLAALILFSISAALSNAPRQSFDSVLLALTYVAAFFVAREYLKDESARAALVRVMVGLSAVLTIVTAARWLPLYLGWWASTDGAVLPPLDINLVAVPWGHRYDLALSIALLYPAWWIGAQSPVRRVTAIVMGVLTAVILLVVGSRALWLSVAIASISVALPFVVDAWHRSSVVRRAFLIGIPVSAVLLVATGVAGPLITRVTTLGTLSARTAMWGPMIDVWLFDPIAGYGPGSMPWILQLTDYFDTNTWVPRHPDSVPVQLLAEVGLLGVGAALIIVGTIVPAVLRGRSAAARWSLVVFILACVAASPTEWPFMMAIVLVWVAYAAPRDVLPTRFRTFRSSAVRAASVAALCIIAVAHVATLGATFSYDRARSLIDEGGLEESTLALDTAIALDPSLALYARQRGAISYLEGDASAAIRDLRRATELSPTDDLAWRTLAMAYEASGEEGAAGAALARAIDLQRSDVTNLLLYSWWHGQHERVAEATDLLAEVVQSSPAIVASPGWAEILPPGVSTGQIVDRAAERWSQKLPSLSQLYDPGPWLAVLAARPELIRPASDGVAASGLAEATISFLRCEPVDDLLRQATATEQRSHLYWMLQLRADVERGHSVAAAQDVLRIMLGDFDTLSGAQGMLNPLNENGATSGDVWGYRRYPVRWPDAGVWLPSPDSGLAYWLRDPSGAVRAAGLEDRVPECG